MDMTSGYHQAPIADECIPLTAFMTAEGIYEWTRLPMGPTGAGSYFQKTMSTEVFNGLVKVICDLYLDDLITYASSETEMIARLRTIFSRCREKRITFNPSKCKFGLTKVEYIGHTIDHEGLHFTRKRLDSILDFELPRSQKRMKSFLGLANYFRDHIDHFEDLAQPMRHTCVPYKPSKKIPWSIELENSFHILVKAINTCPKVYFLDDELSIHLHTDASDYGIGAYLFQIKRIVDKHGLERFIEQPVAFLSKSLDERMSRWDTPQKEGYAIFYALQKWDHLLRDRHFTIHTDHANLMKLREDQYSPNKKVQRWFTAFQHYDFILTGIKGTDNVVADGLSRFCRDLNNEKSEELTSLKLNSYKLSSTDENHNNFLSVHNAELGHKGTAETIRRLKQKDIRWRGMYKDIDRFIKLCPCCQKNNQRVNRNIAFPFTVHGLKPFEKVDIDFIVDLRPDKDGVTTIMVVIDAFSRWVNLFALKERTAENAALALVDHCSNYGTPTKITHDADAVLLGDIVKQTIQLLGADQKKTMAGSKEEQAIVERANKEVMRHLRNFIFDHDALWSYSKYIPLVKRIINASIHKSTGYSPTELIYAGMIDLFRHTVIEQNNMEDKNITYNEWVQQLKTMQLRVLAIAQHSLTEHHEIHMNNYPTNQTEFQVGTYVLVEYNNPYRRGPASKLLPFLKGPMRIINKDKSKYLLEDLISLKRKHYHIKRLTPFNLDITKYDPAKVALRDSGDTFFVDHISDIEGDPKGSKYQLFFKVHWKDKKKPTWEPWKNLRNNESLHKYLKNHHDMHVRKLLPRNMKTANIDSDSEEEEFRDDF